MNSTLIGIIAFVLISGLPFAHDEYKYSRFRRECKKDDNTLILPFYFIWLCFLSGLKIIFLAGVGSSILTCILLFFPTIHTIAFIVVYFIIYFYILCFSNIEL